MKIHRQSTADARNELGQVIGRATFGNEPTILLNRKKEVAVVVSMEFFEKAMEALDLKEDS
jgi:prevent-host-death family protein